MALKKETLFIFEAVELRNEYDRHIKALEGLIQPGKGREIGFFSRDEEEKMEPGSEFSPEKIEETLKKIQTKRVKLNQAIQKANYDVKIEFMGEEIPLSEALEVRKSLLSQLEIVSKRLNESAFKKVIHKEERDITHEPKYSFKKVYKEFQEKMKNLRTLINLIHKANHENTVGFKDE